MRTSQAFKGRNRKSKNALADSLSRVGGGEMSPAASRQAVVRSERKADLIAFASPVGSESSPPCPGLDSNGSFDDLAAQGFASIELPDGAAARIAAAFDAGRRFLACAPNVKLLDRLPLDAGYRPRGVEFSDGGDRPDEVESFSLNGRSDERDLATLSVCGRGLHDRMSDVFEALLPAVSDAVRAITVRYGRELPGLEASLRRWSILQMNFATPSADPARCVNEEHEDGCLVTAMLSTGPGLELRTGDGVFEPAPSDPRRFVLAAGEILWLLTGGDVKPGYHRVRAVEGVTGRMSLLLFADLGPELCAPWRYGDVNRGVDIGRRVLTNATRYGLSAWTPG